MGKVMFSQASVRSHPWGVPPSSWGGYPLPRSRWGVSPSQVQPEGTPFQVQVGGWGRYPLSKSDPKMGGADPRRGVGRGRYTPVQVRSQDRGVGVPPLPGHTPGWGYPLLGQHSVYLLCGGRYASCIHVGGLSFFSHFPFSNVNGPELNMILLAFFIQYSDHCFLLIVYCSKIHYNTSK